MAQINSREVVLLALATATTSAAASDMILPMGYTSAIVTLDIITVSGTSPTLDLKIQNKLTLPAAADLSGNAPTGTAIYDDLLGFAQATTTNTRRVFRLGAGGNNVEAAATDAAISAATARNGPLGAIWRVKYVISGTSPSFAFQVVAQLLP